jgi:hypothetical protein
MSVNNNQTSKAFPYSSFMPFYMNGLGISNDATTPNTKLDVAAGTCLDSTGTFQLTLSSAVVINAASNGLNGLDTGSLAASTVYYVYVVADPVTQQATGAMISASSTPLLPFGYSAYRLIGYVTTDSSSHFLLGYWSDNDSSRRTFTYDAPIQCLSGNQTSYTGVDLSAFVPAVNNIPVVLFSNFTANAAADVENLQGYNSTGDAVTIIAPVAGATAHTTQQNTVLAQLHSGAPSIKYKVSAGSLVLDVCGYTFDL